MIRKLTLAAALVLAAPAMAADEGGYATYELALRAGQLENAADALVAVLEDPEQAADHGKAWRAIATLLETQGLPYASLVAWSHAIATDAQSTAGDIAKVMDLAASLSDEEILGPVLGSNVGIQGLDAPTRSRMAYVAARHQLRRGNLGTALGILMMVEEGTPVFAHAMALRGVVLANQGRHADAVTPLVTAQATARQAADFPEADRFDDVVELNIARTYYGAGNWTQAIEWFNRVDRKSEYWAQAQFERAWAHFRNDDMQQALAALHTHDTPFFDGWYWPEADLLRAYALFTLCKFGSATAEINEFVETYTPVSEALGSQLGALDEAAAFADARTFVEGGTPKLPPMMLRDFRHDDRFAEAVAGTDKAKEELAKLAKMTDRPFVRAAREWVTDRRDERVAEEGARVLDRARKARAELSQTLQAAEITRVDMLQMQAEMYERATETGKLDFGDQIGKLRNLRKARKGYRVWPYQGEVWADELGWFTVDARADCPESLAEGKAR